MEVRGEGGRVGEGGDSRGEEVDTAAHVRLSRTCGASLSSLGVQS